MCKFCIIIFIILLWDVIAEGFKLCNNVYYKVITVYFIDKFESIISSNIHSLNTGKSLVPPILIPIIHSLKHK